MRLNRFLAAAGLGSRRACEQLIVSGAVSLNGSRVEKLATTVGDDDDVRVHGRQIRVARHIYILLNKPKGFVVTRSDERGRRTVYDLLPPELGNLGHVGRLDKDSEGLLLMTNDGGLAQRLTHPSHEIEKEYDVTLDKAFDTANIPRLLRGIYMEGGRARCERVVPVASKRVKVVLRQGMKRQIRLMFYALGYEVERLARIRIGPLRDEGLPSGRFRALTPREVEALAKPSEAPRTRRRPPRTKPAGSANRTTRSKKPAPGVIKSGY